MTQARILVVEDEAVVQVHLRRLVESQGHEVVGLAGTAVRALEIAGRTHPDVALVDVNIEGDVDGIALAGELETRLGVTVVFVTAFADASTLERAGEIGSHGYVVKPFSEAQLKAALTTALAARHHDRDSVRTNTLHDVLSRLGDAVLLTDASGRITFMSPLAESLLGKNSRDFAGESMNRVLEILDVAERDSIAEWIVGGAFPPAPVLVEPVKILLAEGSTARAEVELIPLSSRADASSGWAVLIHVTPTRPVAREARDRWRRRVATSGEFHGMMGRSDPMLTLFERIECLAAVPWTVLIEGETGSGKELAARALHSCGPRSAGPFVAVNCAGIADSLLSSNLFGHRRGAFTGAVDTQIGVFEAASGGTLFLDEIGDVSPSLQKAILRVLDDGMVVRVGETEPRSVDARVVCATQRDLDEEVSAGRFRADLLFRLRGARLAIPPLRVRGDDIALLANHYLSEAARTLGRQIDGFEGDTIAAIRAYAWPGNVRELRSVVHHAALASRTPLIKLTDLSPEVGKGKNDAVDERARLLDALRRAGGNRSRAAALLGVSRATFYRRLEQFGLPED